MADSNEKKVIENDEAVTSASIKKFKKQYGIYEESEIDRKKSDELMAENRAKY